MFKKIISIILFLMISPCFSYPLGFSITDALITTHPTDLKGIRAALIYQPCYLNGRHFQIYFDASLGRWWLATQNNSGNSHLNIYSVAPYLRFFLMRHPIFSPYLELSIGLSYLSQTRLNQHNLGMNFAFQDQFGIGGVFGPRQNAYASLSFLHYSNASFCENNSGITAPLILTIGYRF